MIKERRIDVKKNIILTMVVLLITIILVGCKKENCNESENTTMLKSDDEIGYDGGGADGLTEKYITKPTVVGYEDEVTEEDIRSIINDNIRYILDMVETSANEMSIEYDKNNVYAYIKGISSVLILKEVKINVTVKEIPIFINENIIGVLLVAKNEGEFIWSWSYGKDGVWQKYNDKIGEKDALYVSYNRLCPMIITQENNIYSANDISDIDIDKNIDFFQELYSQYSVIPSDILEKAININDCHK